MLSFSSADIELWLSSFIWPFVRVLSIFTTAPVFSHRALPRRVRVGLAMLITLLLAPALPASGTQGLFTAHGLLLLLQQMLIGFALGFSLRVLFAAIEAAGDLMGLQMGLGFATFINPQNSQQTPIIGSFMGLLASLVFFAINGHLIFLATLAETFTIAPISVNGLQQFNMLAVAQLGSDIFRLSLHLALPVIAAVMLANIALGLLARAAPQLNIFAVGFPATLMIGFWALWLTIPYLGGLFEQTFQRNLLIFLR